MSEEPERSCPPTDAFVSQFDARPVAVSACRKDLVGWMHGANVEDGMVDDLELVFSELAANAVAASPSTSDDVNVRAQLDDGVFVLEVSNRSDRPGQLPDPVSDWDDPLRPRGRGLQIVRALVDSLRMETQPPDRLIVRCRRRLARGR